MQKILRKRVLRDLRANLAGYLALGFLIVLSMYMVVSLIGAAETIIQGTKNAAEENKLEDGEFGVFVPLTEKEEQKLTEKGILLERMFYLDFEISDQNILRVYQNRDRINLLKLDEGRQAEKENESVIEKRYCEENGIHIGDVIEIGEEKIKVTGIGSAPDYDLPLQKISDSSADSSQFGIMFVDKEQYEKLKNSKKSTKAEECVYAYRLNDKMTQEELKKELKKLKLSKDEVSDPFFKEYWDETAGKRDDLEEGIQKLSDGADELTDGLDELDSYGDQFDEASEDIFESYLKQASDGLNGVGLSGELTADNYKQKIDELRAKNDGNGLWKLKLFSIEKQLMKLDAYRSGMKEYTDGVTEAADGSRKLSDGIGELKDASDEILDAWKIDLMNLTQFLPAEDNPRIGAAADDQIVNKMAGLAAGVIVLVLFTYVISVFVVHGIERENSVIGALYALGVKKGDLLYHYLTLPVIVTTLSAVLGTMLGLSRFGIDVQMGDCYAYYSIPELKAICPAYLLLYGIVMPPLTAVVVNYFVIRKKLSRPVLAMIHNEQKTKKVSAWDLKNMGFISRFRVRQMLREMRTGFTVVFGMFISLLIMMLGIDCYVMCKHLNVENKQDTKYEYMYTYKYPTKEVPDGGTESYAVTLKKEILGYNLDVTLLGITEDNPYFDAAVESGKNKIIISSAMAEKYGLHIGDKVILTDEEEDIDYAFTVCGITKYSLGMYAFMDIESMRELFDVSDDYYNVVFSDHALSIPSGRLYGTTSREQIEKSSSVFISMMMPMIVTMVVLSAIIFAVVMYLMMKVMIDRSAFGISLMKIFGYRTKEVKKLYLDGNFFVVAIGAAVCIPASKILMDAIYPMLVSNVACGMNLTFSWQLYTGIYVAIMVLYGIINRLLLRRIRLVLPAEVLKNRE